MDACFFSIILCSIDMMDNSVSEIVFGYRGVWCLSWVVIFRGPEWIRTSIVHFVILIICTYWNLDSNGPSDLVNFCWMPCVSTSMTQYILIHCRVWTTLVYLCQLCNLFAWKFYMVCCDTQLILQASGAMKCVLKFSFICLWSIAAIMQT